MTDSPFRLFEASSERKVNFLGAGSRIILVVCFSDGFDDGSSSQFRYGRPSFFMMMMVMVLEQGEPSLLAMAWHRIKRRRTKLLLLWCACNSCLGVEERMWRKAIKAVT
jgi:hypothetical protein